MSDTVPDLTKVVSWENYRASTTDLSDAELMYGEARDFIEFYSWCESIDESHVGMLFPGIIGVFLFKIGHSREDVDGWVWVVVGDVPPAYITCEHAPNPATALDGYLGAMEDWVAAAESGAPVEHLIPVNAPASKETADMLRSRIAFLDQRILSQYQVDL